MNIPRHIAFIPDGNRRWASHQSLPTCVGHSSGSKNVVSTIAELNKVGVENVSFYVFSSENEKKRTQKEKSGLVSAIEKTCHGELSKLCDLNVRLRFLGRCPDFISEELKALFNKMEEDTKNNTGIQVFFYLGYSARTEIIDVVKSCVDDTSKGKLSIDDIDENVINSKLYASNVPDPDILIRTSGEQRLSNFMLWQLAYTELFFVQKYWPDFSPSDLNMVITQYNQRERRYGA